MSRACSTCDARSTGDRKLRRAGARWRVLAHYPAPRDAAPHRGSLAVEAYPKGPPPQGCHVIDASGTELDEVVVGRFFHMEQMDTGTWWMSIGGVVVWVKADRDGRPLSVDVFAPGQYEDPIADVAYGGAVAPPTSPSKETE